MNKQIKFIIVIILFFLPILKTISQNWNSKVAFGIIGGMPTQDFKNYFPFSYGGTIRYIKNGFNRIDKPGKFITTASIFDVIIYKKKNASNHTNIDSSLYFANFYASFGWGLGEQFVITKNFSVGADAHLLINIIDASYNYANPGTKNPYSGFSFCIAPYISYQIGGKVAIFNEYRLQLTKPSWANSVNIGIIFWCL